ncbi:MAG: hypothetical protein OXQ28_15565, partial [Acidobacteriota bacterium]|nr:hypothetical protein [Acidobacteriota bacterium]
RRRDHLPPGAGPRGLRRNRPVSRWPAAHVERGARVGVHSWASGSVNGDELPRDAPRHPPYLQYYLDIGIAEAFYWLTLEAAPPEGVHWMTEAEMAHYAVYTLLR